MSPFPVVDIHNLRAAEGWLELGNHVEADAELDKITPNLRGHPDVLILRWHIYAKAKKWDACMDIANASTTRAPDDARAWVALAETFYFQGQIQQAYDIATAKASSFPESWPMLYDAACYACLLGKRTEAERYLHLAMAAGDAKEIKLRALDDPDLESLWQPNAQSS